MASLVVLGIEVFIVIVVLAIFLNGIKILKEWERAPVLMLGRFRGLKGPGVIYVPPFIARIPFIISTRLQTVTFKTEQTLTRDNVPVVVDAVMYYKPADLEKVVLGAEDYRTATTLASETTLREVIGQAEFDDLLAEREKMGSLARNTIDTKTEAWGIKVTSVEIRDIGIPPSMQEAMSRQAQAERERRARITLAEAENQAAQKMVEAAKQYIDNDRAFELRWMNMIYEFGKEGGNNTILYIPVNLPAAGPDLGPSSMGYFGLRSILGRPEEKQPPPSQPTQEAPQPQKR